MSGLTSSYIGVEQQYSYSQPFTDTKLRHDYNLIDHMCMKDHVVIFLLSEVDWR
jgi:hypothetical protein